MEEELNQISEEKKEEVRHCNHPRCNKILEHSRKGSKYCSDACRTRHSALRQYEKVKNDEEYKNRRKEKNKKYYQEHKEDLKAKMRVYGMQYFYRKRDERKKLEEENKLKEGINNETNNSVGETVNQTNNSQ